ncbi:MAG: hypothetical protein AAGJ57_12940, partial [Pseudomonadota bacterium]
MIILDRWVVIYTLDGAIVTVATKGEIVLSKENYGLENACQFTTVSRDGCSALLVKARLYVFSGIIDPLETVDCALTSSALQPSLLTVVKSSVLKTVIFLGKNNLPFRGHR